VLVEPGIPVSALFLILHGLFELLLHLL